LDSDQKERGNLSARTKPNQARRRDGQHERKGSKIWGERPKKKTEEEKKISISLEEEDHSRDGVKTSSRPSGVDECNEKDL